MSDDTPESERASDAPPSPASEPAPGAAQTPPGPKLRISGATSSAGIHVATWSAHMATATHTTLDWLSRPRVRVSVVGVLLLVLGALLITNSVWTLPLVIIGVVMVVIAWIGHRLEGRFSLEWGDAGTEVSFRATIKPGPVARASAESGAAQLTAPAPPRDDHRLAGGDTGGQAQPDYIEGEAHTVEVDVSELRALIAAAEEAEAAEAAAAGRARGPQAAEEPPPATGNGGEERRARDFRIHRVGGTAGPQRAPDHKR